MTDKRTVADVLGRYAFALELLEGSSHRSKAYANASRTVWQLQGDLSAMRAAGTLAEVRGLGPTVVSVIATVLDGREPEELASLEASIPGSLLELRRIKGLGPAKIRALWKGLDVLSLADLEQACSENRLVALEGFGKKTQANVIAAIEALRAQEGTLLRDQALAFIARLADALAAAGLSRVVAVGGLARGHETADRLELLVLGGRAEIDAALAAAGVEAGRLEGTQVLAHVADEASFGVRELALTASPGHLARLVEHAARRGLSLTAEGLAGPGGAPLEVRDAEAVYAALGLWPTPAERREDETPLVLLGTPAPALVSRRDLRGALHNHTVASDGSATLAEMRAAAAAAGLAYLGISEHSQSADYARGLTPERLAAQRGELRALNAEAAEGTLPVLLSGVESDILADGSLDYAREELEPLEVVIASGHRRFGLDRAQSTARMIRAARDPMTDVIGHPTGRLLLGRPPNDFDVEAFLDACASSGCAVELNGSPHRLDLEARWLAMARERGVPVSIAADAHATGELAHLEHGVVLARRAGLRPEDVLNTRPLDELRRWLAARRARAASVSA
jgi:DNA polymerase (family 10)